MNTKKSLLYATGVTAASALLLTICNGIPNLEQALIDCLVMFAVAFAVMKLWISKNPAG
jgi:hypothetical protein